MRAFPVFFLDRFSSKEFGFLWSFLPQNKFLRKTFYKKGGTYEQAKCTLKMGISNNVRKDKMDEKNRIGIDGAFSTAPLSLIFLIFFLNFFRDVPIYLRCLSRQRKSNEDIERNKK